MTGDKKPEGGPVDVYRMACFYLKVLDQAKGLDGMLLDVFVMQIIRQD